MNAGNRSKTPPMAEALNTEAALGIIAMVGRGACEAGRQVLMRVMLHLQGRHEDAELLPKGFPR